MSSKLVTYDWSISIYEGENPLNWVPYGPQHPLVTKAIVTDIDADFVADPFLVRHPYGWHLFFEALNRERGLGEIGVASSPNLLDWTYGGIVLREPFHLSYPSVLSSNGTYFMVPESRQSGEVRLYEAARFPYEWKFRKTLLHGDYADPTIYFHEGRWWMFILKGISALWLFSAQQLDGYWEPCYQGELIKDDIRTTRPAGPPFTFKGKNYRLCQDGYPMYGSAVRAFEWQMGAEGYSEKEVEGGPLLKGTRAGWNAVGMHHLDVHQLENGRWIAAVDGAKPVFLQQSQ